MPLRRYAFRTISAAARCAKRPRKFRAITFLYSLTCIVGVVRFMLGHTEVARWIPRMQRELQRRSVDWDGKLEAARAEDVYRVSSAVQALIISLDRTPQRRVRLEGDLEREGVVFKVFGAVDGFNPFDYEDLKKYAGPRKRKKMGRTTWSAGYPNANLVHHERLRFGCYLSHVRVWEHQVKLRLAHQIVLEDDVRLTEGFLHTLDDSLHNLPLGWDIFYLDSCHTKLGGWLRPGIRQVRGALCTHGYVLSLGGATKLANKQALQSEKPVDHMLDEAIYTSVLCAYHADPPLIFRGEAVSTLEYPSS